MKKNFYTLMQSENRKDNADFFAIMVPEFSPDALEKHGRYEWYAGPKRWKYQIGDIQGQLILVVKEKYISDVRQGSPYFYVISKKFLTAISGIKHNFKQILKLDCVDGSGKEIPGDLFAAIPRKFFEPECLTVDKRDHSIEIKPGFDFDLFDVKDIPSSAASLICSEMGKTRFVDAGIRGVEFVPLEQIKYEGLGTYDFIAIGQRKWPV
ncbi:MAG: hypothetical protein FWC42_00530 [Proteobacteria bacterium]|nr:hypothetical protein [Pseudomonadota bacterium]